MKRVLITGSRGMLGNALWLAAPERADVFLVDIEEMDIRDIDSIKRMFYTVRPDYVIHTAAYTMVDKAEDNREYALEINKIGTANLAVICREFNSHIFYISTDYVYNGDKDAPYNEEDAVDPRSVYGLSKLEGEREIEKILQDYTIIRTSWLYGPFGKHFVQTMLRLAETKSVISVVADQFGCPTYTIDLARAIYMLIYLPVTRERLYLFSNYGYTNWASFAKEIFSVAGLTAEVEEIRSCDFPSRACRPQNSRFDLSRFIRSTGFIPRRWEDALRDYFQNYI